MAVWSLCALVGCASIPATSIDLKAGADRIEQQTLTAPSVHAALAAVGLPDAGTDGEWSADALVVAGWELRPELAEARALRTAATEDLKATMHAPAPAFSLIPEFVRHAADASPWTIAVALSFIVKNPARRDAQIDRASATDQRAGWQQAKAAWQIAHEIRSACRLLMLADQALALDEAERTLRDQKIAIARERVNAGTVAPTTLVRADVAAAQSKLLQDQHRMQRAAALTQLTTAIGLRADALDGIRIAVPADSAALLPDWSGLRHDVLFDRLDLADALSAYAELDASWREQNAARMPDLTLSPGFAFDRGEHKWTLGVAGDLPIGARVDATIAAAQARRAAAAQHVLVVQAQALGELSRVHTDWQSLQASRLTADAVLTAQRRVVAAAESRWRAGLARREDWIDARIEQLTLERARQELVVQQSVALTALEMTVQRPVWPASVLRSTEPPVNRDEHASASTAN